MFSRRYILFFFVLFLYSHSCSYAQSMDKDLLVDKLITLVYNNSDWEDQDISIDEVVDNLLAISAKPFNINNASRNRVSELLFLTDYQIESLLQYINESGAVQSFTELGLINGFNEELAEILSNFIILDNTNMYNRSFESNLFLKFSTPLIIDQ